MKLRQQQGITQAELAKRCNLNVRTVQRIETAEATPRNYTVKAIFESLGSDFKDLSLQPDTGHRGVSRFKKFMKQLFKYIWELFNLKTNTMKKLSVLTLLASAMFAGIFFISSPSKAQGNDSRPVEGWMHGGTPSGAYNFGIDPKVSNGDGGSAYIELVAGENEVADNYRGYLMQSFSTNKYLGTRIRMTGYVKTQKAGSANMFLTIYPVGGGEALVSDRMNSRKIIGTKDWTKYEIVLDVPENSSYFIFGFELRGAGKIWFNDIKFEEVGSTVPVTALPYRPVNNKDKKHPDNPTNLKF